MNLSISIQTQEEQTMKKGNGHVVHHVSHRIAEKKKKKDFWKGKNAKVSFKKSEFTWSRLE